MPGKGLVIRIAAAAAAAACVFVAILAAGYALYAALVALGLLPAAAAAVTALVAALFATAAAWLAAGKASGRQDEEEPVGLGQRAFELFRQRPILGTVAVLAGGWIFLRNPALATMVAAAFTEKSHPRRR